VLVNRLNMLLNGYEYITKIEHLAVGDGSSHEVGRANPQQDSGLAYFYNVSANEGEILDTIPVTTIDRYLKEINNKAVDVIKIDVEGTERRCLQGCIDTLRMKKPRLIMIELVEEYLQRYNDSFTETFGFIEGIGYRCVKGPTGIGIQEAKNSCLPGNYFFKRKN
jgi:FkbM family methyltransferase